MTPLCALRVRACPERSRRVARVLGLDVVHPYAIPSVRIGGDELFMDVTGLILVVGIDRVEAQYQRLAVAGVDDIARLRSSRLSKVPGLDGLTRGQ